MSLPARTTGLPGRPVLSQRFVRAVRPPEVSALRGRRFVVLGWDERAEAWFRSWGLAMERGLENLAPDKDMVVVWDASRLAAEEKRRAGVLRDFVAAGGRMVVLAARSWDWPELCAVKIGDTRGSRVFPCEGVKPSLLAGLWPECLQRWNGLPGRVAVGSLGGLALADAEKLLWVREPQTLVAALVVSPSGGPALTGTLQTQKGTILFSQLDVQGRVDRLQPGYDPVAERVLINLLQ